MLLHLNLQRLAAVLLCIGDCWLAVDPVNAGCVMAARVRRFCTDIGPSKPAAAADAKFAAVVCCVWCSAWAIRPLK